MKRQTHDSGFALPTLMAMLALASIATLLALRNLWVNEQLLNAEADQLRTQHKAQAVLATALADIIGTTNATSGSGEVALNLRHTMGNTTQTHVFFPASMSEYDTLRQRLGISTCSAGICAPNTLEVNATKASYWKTQTATAMTVSANDTPDGENAAWYWVEIFPQANASGFIYRITALANGVTSSNVVLQAVWTRDDTATTGQWRSWHLLHD